MLINQLETLLELISYDHGSVSIVATSTIPYIFTVLASKPYSLIGFGNAQPQDKQHLTVDARLIEKLLANTYFIEEASRLSLMEGTKQ